MKKLLMTAAVLATASIVTAQTVTSANIVGYNKDVADTGILEISGMQFVGGTDLRSAYGDSYPMGTVCYVYNIGTGLYDIFIYIIAGQQAAPIRCREMALDI